MCGRCFQSTRNQIHFLLRGANPTFTLLFEGVQQIDRLLKPDRIHGPVGISPVIVYEFNHTAPSETLQGFSDKRCLP